MTAGAETGDVTARGPQAAGSCPRSWRRKPAVAAFGSSARVAAHIKPPLPLAPGVAPHAAARVPPALRGDGSLDHPGAHAGKGVRDAIDRPPGEFALLGAVDPLAGGVAASVVACGLGLERLDGRVHVVVGDPGSCCRPRRSAPTRRGVVAAQVQEGARQQGLARAGLTAGCGLAGVFAGLAHGCEGGLGFALMLVKRGGLAFDDAVRLLAAQAHLTLRFEEIKGKRRQAQLEDCLLPIAATRGARHTGGRARRFL